jgi:hypothetical protein
MLIIDSVSSQHDGGKYPQGNCTALLQLVSGVHKLHYAI